MIRKILKKTSHACWNGLRFLPTAIDQWQDSVRFEKAIRAKKILPEFLIVGFPRCGTTALGFNLNQSDEICCLHEAGLFTLGLSPERMVYWNKLKPGKKNGEKYPVYISDRPVMKAIQRALPDLKLIICLRHPIQALHSFYQLRASEGSERGETWMIPPQEISFSRMVLEEIDIDGTGQAFKSYIKSIQNNVLPFFSRDQILFVIQERMLNDMPGQMKRVFDFLGARSPDRPDYHQGRCYSERNQYQRIDYENPDYPRAIQKLVALYTPSNEKLFDFLGERIPEWETTENFYRKFLK